MATVEFYDAFETISTLINKKKSLGNEVLIVRKDNFVAAVT